MTANELTVDLIPKPATDIEAEVFDDEVILYHPRNTRGVYLNSTAAVVWGLSDGTRSVREIVQLLSDCYPESDIARHVFATLDQLTRSGLLVVS